MPMRLHSVRNCVALCLLLLLLVGRIMPSFGQTRREEAPAARSAAALKRWKAARDTGVVMVQLAVPTEALCKARRWNIICFPYKAYGTSDPASAPLAKKTPLIKVHGNISYSYDYRSQLDTPFEGSNVQQHNEQVYADATVKGKYPFRIVVDSRQSNSPYFRNYTDVNVQFNHPQFQQMEKQRLIDAYNKKLDSIYNPAAYEQRLRSEEDSIMAARNWLNDPVRKQEIIQERQALYNRYVADSLARLRDSSMHLPSNLPISAGVHSDTSANAPFSKDSLLARLGEPTSTEQKIKKEQRLADSLLGLMDSARKVADSVSKVMHTAMSGFAGRVDSAGSAAALEALQKESGATPMDKTDKTLMSFKKVSVGRSAINYSDLTVNGISLNGVDIEYNPSYYTAFAAGVVDYLFRDFLLQPGQLPKQKLVVGRFGWGDVNRRAWILTIYNGTKDNIGGTVSDTSSATPVTQSTRVFGYSLQMLYKLSKNIDMAAEWAKSSTPGSSQANGDGGGHVLSFSDHSNEAWSLRMNMDIPKFQSSVSGFYRLIGADFQSYSIFSTGARQVQWGIKWKQSLFQKQLTLSAEVKKSGFDDPLLAQSYSSSTIFESIQAVYRRKKWPVFTLGYMPSTQLTKSSDGTVTESMYYTLTGSVMYSYQVKQVNMNTSLLYSRFYNRGTDSGFVAYDARNILLSHNMNWKIWGFQSQVQYTSQPGLLYWTLEQTVSARIGRYLTVGAGVSDYLVPAMHSEYRGGLLQSTLQMSKWGSLRVQYNKAYIPDATGGLSSSNWGKATWYKIF